MHCPSDGKERKNPCDLLGFSAGCGLRVTSCATRNPQLATRNSQPVTRIPQLATRNSQPATRNATRTYLSTPTNLPAKIPYFCGVN